VGMGGSGNGNDCMGMRGNGNSKSHSRTSLIHSIIFFEPVATFWPGRLDCGHSRVTYVKTPRFRKTQVF